MLIPLMMLAPKHWMTSVYLIQYSVNCILKHQEKVSYCSEGMEQASEREAGQGSRSQLLDMATPQSPPLLLLVLPFIFLTTPVGFRDLRVARTQLFFQLLCAVEPLVIKGRALSISSLLTIAVLNFQLCNLSCITSWYKNVGDFLKITQ